METKQKLIILVIGLIGSMYYFIERDTSPGQRIISILILAALAYFTGKYHAEYLASGRIRATDGLGNSPGPSNNNGWLDDDKM